MQNSITSNSKKNLYEQDFYQWIQNTATLLKEKQFEQVDWENVIEEIESMGRSEKRELLSRLITIIEHLLKLQYWEAEKAYNERGWRVTVVEQRSQLELTLEDSPSLKPILEEVFLDCYQKARKVILKKYQLSSNMFPSEPPFTIENVLNSDYFPE
ncbi:DUF29 domain-containing protein [Aphanothece hegewaldii CCALA 016]|uniref:DUF29 domain-containing protein n=1 Tax=Aphanothece hegewaldii CCALA 016 TaxID=2107694 RepID=A0A2T1M050_9CHRO|nr:DUF29 domain-containing protein [Aphanothece hegewaldii]PSF38020.1 DUF29 domain-containing protein [Aphanothece hegewaldii CCALA 016]